MVAQAMRIWILHDLLTSEVWTLFRVCAVNTKNEDTMQSSWSITHSNNGITSVTNVNQQFRVISLINLIIVIVIYDAINMTMLSKWFAVKRISVFFYLYLRVRRVVVWIRVCTNAFIASEVRVKQTRFTSHSIVSLWRLATVRMGMPPRGIRARQSMEISHVSVEMTWIETHFLFVRIRR